MLIETFRASCRSNFQYPVKLFRRQVVIKKVHRIDFPAIYMHFIMTMWARTFARASHPTNHFSRLITSPALTFTFDIWPNNVS